MIVKKIIQVKSNPHLTDLNFTDSARGSAALGVLHKEVLER